MYLKPSYCKHFFLGVRIAAKLKTLFILVFHSRDLLCIREVTILKRTFFKNELSIKLALEYPRRVNLLRMSLAWKHQLPLTIIEYKQIITVRCRVK